MLESKFPCNHGFGDIVRFKYNTKGIGKRITNGIIVGVVIGGSEHDNYYAEYKVHSLPGEQPEFYFMSVAEHNIIND